MGKKKKKELFYENSLYEKYGFVKMNDEMELPVPPLGPAGPGRGL